MAADLNAPRTIIPTLQPGDPIRQSWVNGVGQALNGGRGVSNPPSQVHTTKGGGGGTTLLVVKAASTANVASLSGTTTIDGVALSAGDTVLLKNQSTASQNGVYTVAAGTWTGPSQPGMVFVTNGTASASVLYVLKATNTYTAAAGVYS